jgi:hypothetical protein
MKQMIERQWKAIVGAAVAGVGVAVAAAASEGISQTEALGIALAALVGYQGVYWTKNKDEA